MKKLFILIAILLICSVSTSQAFFTIADPQNAELGANVKIPVYNFSSSALGEGDVVVWDVGNSTGDNDLYVNTTTTASTALVAGVVSQGGIAAKSAGSIIVYGLAQCDVGVSGAAAGSILCSGTVAGDGLLCSSTANESFGYAITSEAIGRNGQGKCFVGGK